MPANGSTSLTLPGFSGATRKLILLHVAVFFGLALLRLAGAGVYGAAIAHLGLVPAALVHGAVWQPLTYGFVQVSVVSAAFAMLSLWGVGAALEGLFTPRWMVELYLVSLVGGGLLASALAFVHPFGITPGSIAFEPWPGIFGLLLAFARYFGDQQVRLFFVLSLKARYLVAIYAVFYLALVVSGSGAFEALVFLMGGAAAWIYLSLAGRRGVTYTLSERWFAARNTFYRSKRRRAARKFEVYMRKQNREVRFDKDGRYIEPDERAAPRGDGDPPRWMN